jgi:hypothetical protein
VTAATADDPAGSARESVVASGTAGPVDKADDRLTAALDHLADSAEKTSAEQQVIADSARAMSEERRRGRSWGAILAGEGQPPVVALLGASLRRLTQTSGRVRTAVAAALLKEGLSTRQIASYLGVTHQRVSAMLNRPRS